MTWRLCAEAVSGGVPWSGWPTARRPRTSRSGTAARTRPDASVQYLPLDAPAGMSQAVVVQGQPLVHTRQLLPLDREGKLVGEGSVDKQIEQVLNNLDAVLSASGSGLGKLVRLNVYAIAPPTVDRVREQLSKRLDACRPSGDHRGPDAHAAPQGAGGRRCGRGGGREGPDRGLAALRSRGRRQGLRRRRGVAAGRCGVPVRRAGRKRTWRCRRSRSRCPPCGRPSNS